MDADSLAWLLSNVAWGLGGLALGYFLGSIGREVHELRETLVTENEPTPTPPPAHDRRNGGGDRRQSRSNAILGIVMVLLAVVSVTVAAVAVSEREDRLDRIETQVDCEADYLVEYAVAINERTDAVIADRHAIRALIETTAELQTLGLPERERQRRFQAAVQVFLEASSEADKTRAQAPLPIPPRDCLPENSTLSGILVR